jgi:hypothetical protein
VADGAGPIDDEVGPIDDDEAEADANMFVNDIQKSTTSQ